MPTIFRFALLSAVTAQSLTALANPSCSSRTPTPDDLEVAVRELKRFRKPVVFEPKEASDFTYVKDRDLEVWIINSFVVGEGAQGCVRHAWKAAVGLQPPETPRFVVKILNVDQSELVSRRPYTNEIEALKALKREPADVLVSKKGTTDTKGVVHFETECNKFGNYGYRCNGEAEAYIFQLLIKGTNAAHLKIYYNPKAISNLQEGLRRELRELHSKGWVHGDPQIFNFMADDTGIPDQYNVKAVDFGLSFKSTAAADLKEGHFDDVAALLKHNQFTRPFYFYTVEMRTMMEKDSEHTWSPMTLNKMEQASVNDLQKIFGHVEDWEIKLAHMGALNEFDESFSKETQYYESLLKQVMSQRALNDDVSPDARTVRLLEDAKLARSSFETVYQNLNALGADEMRRARRKLRKAEEYVKGLSQEIVRLQASLGIVEAAKVLPSFGWGASDNLDAQSLHGKIPKVPAKAPTEASTHAVGNPKPQPAPSTSDQAGKVPDHAHANATDDESKLGWDKKGPDHGHANAADAGFYKLGHGKEGSDHVPASEQPNSSNSFSGSLRKTMTVAAATTLVCFALATFSV